MSGYLNPESANLKRLRELYASDRNAALREIYRPRPRIPRITPEEPRLAPQTTTPAYTRNLPQNIGDYNIFQFKQAIRNDPQSVKQYINAIPWGPAGNFKAFDDFMTGQGTLRQCKGLNCYQNSFLNLMANQAKTRSRDASPARVYGEERGNLKGFSPTEENFETLFDRIYRYPEQVGQANIEPTDEEVETQLKKRSRLGSPTEKYSDSSSSSEGEPEQTLAEVLQRSSQGLQATSQAAAQRSSSLPNLSSLQNVPKNTVAYSYPRGVGGHTILADEAGTPNDSIWRSLQMRNAAPRNLDALNLANLEDIGPWNMIYTNRFK